MDILDEDLVYIWYFFLSDKLKRKQDTVQTIQEEKERVLAESRYVPTKLEAFCDVSMHEQIVKRISSLYFKKS